MVHCLLLVEGLLASVTGVFNPVVLMENITLLHLLVFLWIDQVTTWISRLCFDPNSLSHMLHDNSSYFFLSFFPFPFSLTFSFFVFFFFSFLLLIAGKLLSSIHLTYRVVWTCSGTSKCWLPGTELCHCLPTGPTSSCPCRNWEGRQHPLHMLQVFSPAASICWAPFCND